MLQREESRHDFAFLAGVIVGAIAGALATLALTPMSGAETRERLRDTTSNLGPVKEKMSDVATTAGNLMATGKEKATDLVAKTPLPVGRNTEDEDRVMSETASADTTKLNVPTTTTAAATSTDVDSGFGPHGGHTQAPAEGAPLSEQGSSTTAQDVVPDEDKTGNG
jgi:gas vesicle protein